MSAKSLQFIVDLYIYESYCDHVISQKRDVKEIKVLSIRTFIIWKWPCRFRVMCIQCSFNDLECSEVEYEKLRLIFYMNPDLISNLRERKKGRSWLKSTTRDLWWFLITETFKNCRFPLVWFWPFHHSTIQSILPFPKLLLRWLLEIPLCLSLLLRYFKYKSAQSVGYFIFYIFKKIKNKKWNNLQTELTYI